MALQYGCPNSWFIGGRYVYLMSKGMMFFSGDLRISKSNLHLESSCVDHVCVQQLLPLVRESKEGVHFLHLYPFLCGISKSSFVCNGFVVV